jgi:iron complex transport system substrate-binding protein
MLSKNTNHELACRKGIFLWASNYYFVLYFLAGCLLLGQTACEQASKPHSPAVKVTSQEDLFPDKVEIKHSRGFTVSYGNNYKVVNIFTHFENQADTIQYILLQRGTSLPAGLPQAQIIEIPLHSLVVMSSMHIALADFVDAADVLTGIGNLKYVNATAVRENIKAGKVVEAGIDASMNEELLISLQPDLLMAMGSPNGKIGRYKTLQEAGVPVMINSEWLESTPLARAEWVKLMAVLLNKEALVNQKFAAVEQEYHKLVQLAQTARTKPVIVTGMPYKGTWFVPDGDSYMCQFLKDAGASYQWADTKGLGSLALDFETVAPVALQADYWLNVGYVNSRDDIKAKDIRYTDFKPFQQGRIYNNNKKVNDLGANDYWESGAVHPHVVLADLIKILHPELLPGHELVYYKQLP